RQDRPQLYALHGTRPPPLVAREDRIGIDGRLDEGGNELEPLAPASLAALREQLGDTESIAIVLLHRYANDAHERAVAEALDESEPVPQRGAQLAEHREHERGASTVVNAYGPPRMGGYLERVGRMPGRVREMGSGAGALSNDPARRETVHTV